jgi:hypothetical protein
MTRAASLLVVSLAACARLGPTPVATGLTPVPASRPEVELQAGAMPGYFLSEGTQARPRGEPLAEATVAVDGGGRIGPPGLVAAARIVGPEHDVQLEPILGYRRAVGRWAFAGALHGTYGAADDGGASYEATRGGLELLADLRLGDPRRWFEPHVVAGLSITALTATGDYCLDERGEHGIDCPGDVDERTSVEVAGVYPSATLGVALHLGEHRDGRFHRARLLWMVAAGVMPAAVGGEQVAGRAFGSVGAALSIAFGAGT